MHKGGGANVDFVLGGWYLNTIFHQLSMWQQIGLSSANEIKQSPHITQCMHIFRFSPLLN